jgi:membrane-bound lytic murein transglycosylase B
MLRALLTALAIGLPAAVPGVPLVGAPLGNAAAAGTSAGISTGVPVTPAIDTAVYPGTTPAAPPPATIADNTSFDAWLAGYRATALARGVTPATLDQLLTGLVPSPRVVELDRAQPGDSGGAPARFDAYLAKRLDSARVSGGYATAARLSGQLAAIAARTGVPAGIIIGIWGMETSYGRVTGDFDVTRSLATLAWDGRRRELFTRELDAIVTIVDRGLAPRALLRGSWAGAMGQPQFLPSSYLAYAADGDGDGRIDIWNSDADTAASIANYLEKHGWARGLGWGQSVTLPTGFDREAVRNPVRPTTCIKPMERHSRWLPAADWRRLGVTSARPLPADATPMSLVEPDGAGQGAYLTTANYRVLMDYNCSNFYALSVALLGDAVAPAVR